MVKIQGCLFDKISMAFRRALCLFVLLCESEQCIRCENDGNFQRAEVLTCCK